MTFTSLAPYGWNDRWAARFADAVASVLPAVGPGASGGHAVPARVVRHDSSAVLAATPDGIRSLTMSRTLDPPPAVGDWLVVRDGAPLAVLARTSLLARHAPIGAGPQALAANVDLVLITCGVDRPTKAGRIDRTATLAWNAGATPVIVLTKIDLIGRDQADGLVAELGAAHRGLDVLATSTATGIGVDSLRSRGCGRTLVLIGESGAGKSSLVNALVGHQAAATGAVRRGDAKGRHTTSARQAHLIPNNGLLIDTPGLRAVGLWADADDVSATFGDVEDLARSCRFGDCAHVTEPGCAVLTAVEDGTLPASRLEAWRALQREAASLARRADPHAQRQWGKRFARMAKDAQRHKGQR